MQFVSPGSACFKYLTNLYGPAMAHNPERYRQDGFLELIAPSLLHLSSTLSIILQAFTQSLLSVVFL